MVPWMRTTFMHKVILTILAGFLTAGLFEFYKTFVSGADEAINGGYNNRSGISNSTTHPQ